MFLANLDGGSEECAWWKVSKTVFRKLNIDVRWEHAQRPKSSSRTVWTQIHFQQHILVNLSLREWMAASHGDVLIALLLLAPQSFEIMCGERTLLPLLFLVFVSSGNKTFLES